MKQLIKAIDSGQARRNPQKKRTKGSLWIIIVLTAFVIVLCLVCASLWNDTISIGAKALANHYTETYNQEKNKISEDFHNRIFEWAEAQYHVSNRMVISIGDIESTQRLEVLKARDIEFVTEDKDSNSGNITAWLKVTGEGTFVVDLQAAEFILDHEHQYVHIRIPCPELTDVTIIHTEKLWFKDDWWNGSYSEGLNLALRQRNEAILQITNSLMSNQDIYENAKDIAKGTISNWVKQFNPDIPTLTVDVEFM